jgi:hypothetical protein
LKPHLPKKQSAGTKDCETIYPGWGCTCKISKESKEYKQKQMLAQKLVLSYSSKIFMQLIQVAVTMIVARVAGAEAVVVLGTEAFSKIRPGFFSRIYWVLKTGSLLLIVLYNQ